MEKENRQFIKVVNENIVESVWKLELNFNSEEVIIIGTEDALLICSKDKAQNVKKVLKELKKRKMGYLELSTTR